MAASTAQPFSFPGISEARISLFHNPGYSEKYLSLQLPRESAQLSCAKRKEPWRDNRSFVLSSKQQTILMDNKSRVLAMSFASVYPMYLQKAEKERPYYKRRNWILSYSGCWAIIKSHCSNTSTRRPTSEHFSPTRQCAIPMPQKLPVVICGCRVERNRPTNSGSRSVTWIN